MGMKHLLGILFVALLLGSCGSGSNPKPTAAYEEKKTSLADMERDSPARFLKISGSNRNNLVNQTVIEGEIMNKATLITYKSIQIQVTFIDKEGSTIEKQKHSIDDEIKPGSSDDFKIKTSHVKGANSVTFQILDAKAE